MARSVFVSYSWHDKDIADALEALFNDKGIRLERDVRDVRYPESIRTFMGRVRSADYCLMLISESFLKSAKCMYEVLEFVKDESFRDRILPVLVGDAKIFSAEDRARYVVFWQKRQEVIDQER